MSRAKGLVEDFFEMSQNPKIDIKGGPGQCELATLRVSGQTSTSPSGSYR